MVKDGFIREILYYKNYYLKFFSTLTPDVQRKINWTLKLIATLDRIPAMFFKHVEGTNGIYEIRVEVGNDVFRMFSFFDSRNLVVIINGFRKKSQKAPRREIEQAKRLKKQYFNEKETV